MSAMPAVSHDVGQFFVPDLITPQQYVDRTRASTSDRPELRLMLAVMENGIATYLRYAAEAGTPARRRARRLYGEARAWLDSDDTSWPYSFANLCDALGFDAAQLRRGLGLLRRTGDRLTLPVERISLRRISGSRHVIGAGTERLRPRRSARERRAARAQRLAALRAGNDFAG